MTHPLLQHPSELIALPPPERPASPSRLPLSAEFALATELLEALTTGDLDRHLLGMMSRVTGATPTPAHRRLGPLLAQVARRSLSGWDARGTRQHLSEGGLRTAAARMFGMELEGLSEEDQDFELARALVRLSARAAQGIRDAPIEAQQTSPSLVALRELRRAARTAAPGLYRARATGLQNPRGISAGPRMPQDTLNGTEQRRFRRA